MLAIIGMVESVESGSKYVGGVGYPDLGDHKAVVLKGRRHACGTHERKGPLFQSEAGHHILIRLDLTLANGHRSTDRPPDLPRQAKC